MCMKKLLLTTLDGFIIDTCFVQQVVSVSFKAILAHFETNKKRWVALKLIAFSILIVPIAYGQIVSSPDVTICPNQNMTLTSTISSTGNVLSIAWTPSVGLSTPLQNTTITSPNITTTYTVSSMVITGNNLGTNGDFEQGAIDFSSEYIQATNNGQLGGQDIIV